MRASSSIREESDEDERRGASEISIGDIYRTSEISIGRRPIDIFYRTGAGLRCGIDCDLLKGTQEGRKADGAGRVVGRGADTRGAKRGGHRRGRRERSGQEWTWWRGEERTSGVDKRDGKRRRVERRAAKERI